MEAATFQNPSAGSGYTLSFLDRQLAAVRASSPLTNVRTKGSTGGLYEGGAEGCKPVNAYSGSRLPAMGPVILAQADIGQGAQRPRPEAVPPPAAGPPSSLRPAQTLLPPTVRASVAASALRTLTTVPESKVLGDVASDETLLDGKRPPGPAVEKWWLAATARSGSHDPPLIICDPDADEDEEAAGLNLSASLSMDGFQGHLGAGPCRPPAAAACEEAGRPVDAVTQLFPPGCYREATSLSGGEELGERESCPHPTSSIGSAVGNGRVSSELSHLGITSRTSNPTSLYSLSHDLKGWNDSSTSSNQALSVGASPAPPALTKQPTRSSPIATPSMALGRQRLGELSVPCGPLEPFPNTCKGSEWQQRTVTSEGASSMLDKLAQELESLFDPERVGSPRTSALQRSGHSRRLVVMSPTEDLDLDGGAPPSAWQSSDADAGATPSARPSSDMVWSTDASLGRPAAARRAGGGPARGLHASTNETFSFISSSGCNSEWTVVSSMDNVAPMGATPDSTLQQNRLPQPRRSAPPQPGHPPYVRSSGPLWPSPIGALSSPSMQCAPDPLLKQVLNRTTTELVGKHRNDSIPRSSAPAAGVFPECLPRPPAAVLELSKAAEGLTAADAHASAWQALESLATAQSEAAVPPGGQPAAASPARSGTSRGLSATATATAAAAAAPYPPRSGVVSAGASVRRGPAAVGRDVPVEDYSGGRGVFSGVGPTGVEDQGGGRVAFSSVGPKGACLLYWDEATRQLIPVTGLPPQGPAAGDTVPFQVQPAAYCRAESLGRPDALHMTYIVWLNLLLLLNLYLAFWCVASINLMFLETWRAASHQ